MILLTLFMAYTIPAGAEETGLPWWKDAPGPAYQVLAYSFADSDGDGWGDIDGLRGALDYLGDELGVSALWLSPVQPASSYHGYDVTDYKGIDPRLGNIEDFDAFVRAAHGKGIKVIMDMVFNHSSREHPWFLDAIRSSSSPYLKYYRTRQAGTSYGSGGLGRFYRVTRADGSTFEYFSAFWEGMPDLNLDNTDVVNELKDVLAFWLQKGVDGFRFDAAKHAFDPNEMPGGTATLALNKAFWTDLRRSARRTRPDVFFIGEVLSENAVEVAAYAGVFDSLFDFPVAKGVLDAVGRGSPGNFFATYSSTAAQYARYPAFTPSPLLTNHDQDRVMSAILSRLGLNAAAGAGPASSDSMAVAQAKAAALVKAKLAASITQSLPGLPFVYYGEELGMTGRRYKNDDVARRDAFPWHAASERGEASEGGDDYGVSVTAWMKSSGKLEPGQNSQTPSLEAQRADAGSLWHHYKNLAALRATSPAIRHGTFARVGWPGFEGSYTLAWLRQAPEQTVLVLHNLDSAVFKFADPGLSLLWNSEKGLVAGQAETSGTGLPGGGALASPAAGASAGVRMLELKPGQSGVYIVIDPARTGR
jgi:glycosidase